MQKKTLTFILAINILIIIGLYIFHLLQSLPFVGHDYGYFVPRLLDTYIYSLQNGISIQWYTPSFGGGLPAYPNPQQIQYSLPQFLLFFFPPLTAICLSLSIFVCVGFLSTYHLLANLVKLHWTSSLLGAIFFSTNGFMLERFAVGHLGYQTFPLLALLLCALIDTSMPRLIAVIFVSLIFTGLIHQAGFYVIVIFALSSMITLPLIQLRSAKPLEIKRILFVVAFGGLATIVMSASKLSAVYSLMRYFPRLVSDTANISPIMLLAIPLQLMGAMNLIPLSIMARTPIDTTLFGISQFVSMGYGFWEFDMSMSPIVFIIIIMGVLKELHNLKSFSNFIKWGKNWQALILIIFSLWLTIQFIYARGSIYDFLHQLPIISSLHVNERFTSALIFPIAFIAASLHNYLITEASDKRNLLILAMSNILTLISFSAYCMPLVSTLQARTYNISTSYPLYETIRIGKALPVTQIIESADDIQPLIAGASNLHPYEPVFGYGLEYFHPEIKTGSVFDNSGGYYNMTNPAGYIFPENNNTRPFERIKVSEIDKLNAFIEHGAPDWQLPIDQKILDLVSGLAVIFGIFVLANHYLFLPITRFTSSNFRLSSR